MTHTTMVSSSNDTRVALVTGANKGIGLETARQLGAAGITVWLGARDEQRGRSSAAELRAGGTDVHFVRLDVTDPDMIEAAAKRVDAEHGRLDILVNNAGIVGTSGRRPPSETVVDDHREIYDTNVFGAIAVTNAMLPLLRQSIGGWIVNVSSTLGSLALATGPPTGYDSQTELLGYCSSKAALNMMTLLYARELRDSPIKVNAVDPGYCATDLNGFQGVLTAAEGAEVTVRAATLPDDGPTGSILDGSGAVAW